MASGRPSKARARKICIFSGYLPLSGLPGRPTTPPIFLSSHPSPLGDAPSPRSIRPAAPATLLPMDPSHQIALSPVRASTALMVRPAFFGYCDETARSNAFQNRPVGMQADELILRARSEFEALAAALRDHGVDLVIADADPARDTPDALFPNNWITFHTSGAVVLYPMCAPTRRREVRPELIDLVEAQTGARWPSRLDLTHLADRGAFLEGTGSLVFDPLTAVAYACRSPRTTEEGLRVFSEKTGVEVHAFDAADPRGVPIYHTNVMMSVGVRSALVCLNCVAEKDRAALREAIETEDRELVEISYEQVASFAGNALELVSRDGEPLLVMSEQARRSLTPEQLAALEARSTIVSADLGAIEYVAGGSARCMIAAVYLPSDAGGTGASKPDAGPDASADAA